LAYGCALLRKLIKFSLAGPPTFVQPAEALLVGGKRFT
jgi:hypothetical protein